MSELPTAEEVLEGNDRFNKLCQTVFGSGSGKELLDELVEMYCNGRLFEESDRATVYNIAHRDLIMELKNITES